MKKFIVVMTVLLMACTFVFAQGQGEAAESTMPTLKVGMVTDAGHIDDKSFNQGTWEGIKRAETDFGVQTKYLQPAGTTPADYTKEIGNLIDAGYTFVVTPGFKFETSIYEAQDRWPDAKFVILDGDPHDDSYNYKRGDNTVSVLFYENESSFVAGVAAAVSLQDAEFGFIGGMEIPAVQKYNWGFQQGLAYANENYGTNCTMKAENCIYQGTFSDVAAGQQLAASMYDKGVDCVFAAAGGVGVGCFTEAKTRAQNGQNVWMVGVDVDQYGEGLLPNGKSITLTSSMKKLDAGSYLMIEDELNGEFPGGQQIILSAKNDGVGIPAENPNLSAAAIKAAADAFAGVKSGAIIVLGADGKLPAGLIK